MALPKKPEVKLEDIGSLKSTEARINAYNEWTDYHNARTDRYLSITIGFLLLSGLLWLAVLAKIVVRHFF